MDDHYKTLDEGFVSTNENWTPEYVSAWIRFANHFIDTVAIYLIYFIVVFVITLLSGGELSSKLILYSLYFAIVLSYYILMEHNTGKTIGKMITKCHVVNINGEKPRLSTIVKRTFSRLIPLEALSFLGKNVGLHDSISDTYVVTNQRVNTI